MDIDILLGLQAFRNGSGAILAEFLSKMSKKTDTPLTMKAASAKALR